MKIFGVVAFKDNGQYGEGVAYIAEKTETDNYVVYDYCLESQDTGEDFIKLVSSRNYAIGWAEEEREAMYDTYKDIPDFDVIKHFEAESILEMYRILNGKTPVTGVEGNLNV